MRNIIAVTSWRPRLPFISIAINSILEGNILPDKIVLTLFKEDVQYITSSLEQLIETNKIELIICNDDLGCAKRWYYVMQKYPDDNIIIIDDDIIYPKNFLQDILHYSNVYPNTIICRWGRPVIFNDENNIQPFLTTQKQYHFISEQLDPSYLHHFICGAGGTFFPPHSINCSDVDIATIHKYKQIDEVLLKYLSLKTGTKVKIIPYKSIHEVFTLIKHPDIQQCSLWNINKNTSNIMHNDVGYRELLIPEFKRLQCFSCMFNNLVTVVIPFYNPDIKLFNRCLDSLISQSIGFENIRVTLINDGSTNKDSIQYIRDNYVIKYGNIELININTNKGPGNARNVGLEQCNTKYITFMDYDDYYYDNYVFAEVVQHLEYNPDSDILVGGRSNNNTEEVLYSNIPKLKLIKASNVREKELLFTPNLVSPQNKFYKTEFLKNNNIKFTNHRSAQDRLFYFTCVLVSKNIIIYNKPLFVYYKRNIENSNITNTFNFDTLLGCIEVEIELISLFKNTPELSHIPTNNYNDILRRYNNTVNKLDINQQEVVEEKIKKIRDYHNQHSFSKRNINSFKNVVWKYIKYE